MDKMWFYRRVEGEQHGPVPEAKIRELLAAGELQSTHEAWTEGMDAWQRIDQLPAFTAAPSGGVVPQAPLPVPAPTAPTAPAAPAASTATARKPLPEGLTGWMTFLGIVTIAGGALSVLSCVGLPTGVLQIIAGVALFGGKTALEGVRDVDASLLPFFEKLKTFVLMTSIVFILGIVMALIGVIFYFSVIAAALSGSGF